VTLRRLSAADLASFQGYRHDESVGRFQGWTAQPDPQALAFLEAMGSARLFVPGEWVQLGVAETETNALIGDIGVRVADIGEKAEIGFTVRAHSQGSGLGTQAVREAIQLLFQCTGVMEVVAITDARNIPSIRLLERVGMRKVAMENTVFRGEPCIECVYALSRVAANALVEPASTGKAVPVARKRRGSG
jgi:RimJ/RimL family protein N-acetyltransferase